MGLSPQFRLTSSIGPVMFSLAARISAPMPPLYYNIGHARKHSHANIRLLKCLTLLAIYTAITIGDCHAASFFSMLATLTCCAPMFTCTALGLSSRRTRAKVSTARKCRRCAADNVLSQESPRDIATLALVMVARFNSTILSLNQHSAT